MQVGENYFRPIPYPCGVRLWIGSLSKGAKNEILARYDQATAVVTHGGVIMVLLSACLGLGFEKRFRFLPMANCSITTLVYDKAMQSLRVGLVNDTTHLEFPERI